MISKHQPPRTPLSFTISKPSLQVPRIAFDPFPSPSIALQKFNLPLLIPSPPPSPNPPPRDWESEHQSVFDDLDLTQAPPAIWSRSDWETIPRSEDDGSGSYYEQPQEIASCRRTDGTKIALIQESSSQCPTPRPRSVIEIRTTIAAQPSESEDELSPLQESFGSRSTNGSIQWGSSSCSSFSSSDCRDKREEIVSSWTGNTLDRKHGQTAESQSSIPAYGYASHLGGSRRVSAFIGEDELMEGLCKSV